MTNNYPISVKVIADSVNANYPDYRVITIECEYPRYIHAEVMTHREFSRNAQSSRAVPVAKALEIIRNNPVMPLVWGENKPGMSSKAFLDSAKETLARAVWKYGSTVAVWVSEALSKIGLHKQWANRVTEPFSTIKVVITATEWENAFWLRLDEDAAQPEIVLLFKKIKEAIDASIPCVLEAGEWHMPYVESISIPDQTDSGFWNQVFIDSNDNELTIEEALKISASCCAQVSYRKLDDSKEKAIEIYDKLFSGPKPHLSPTEHQAKCLLHPVAGDCDTDRNPNYWEEGITHLDRNSNYRSGNLKGWVQYRQVIGVI